MEVVEQWIGWVRQYPPVLALLVLVGAALSARLVDVVLCRVLKRVARRTQTELDDRLIDLLHRPIFFSVLMIGVYLALSIWSPPAALFGLIIGLLKTIAILIWTVTLLRLVKAVLESFSRLSERVRWLDTRSLPLFDNLAKLLLFGGAVYFLLMAWNLDLGPWLASAGVLALAVGFAAKDTLANLFGGMFVIMDAPYKIGDYINLDSGERGRVIKIGLRSTRLLTRDDVEITIPNAQIAMSKIVNESGGPWEKLRITAVIGVAYGSDVDQVHEVLMRTAKSVAYVVDDPEPRVRFTEFGDSALIFRVQCWVDEPGLRGLCIDALNTAIYKSLNAEKITIPFPQRDVHLIRATGS